MTQLTAQQVERLEAKGFKRWQKNGNDRLYINPESYGVEFEYYKTGNISRCTFNGERVSNSDGYRFKNAKVYIDVTTGELHVSAPRYHEDAVREAVEAIVAECTEDEEEVGDMGERIDTTKIEKVNYWMIACICNDINDVRPGTCEFRTGHEDSADLKVFGVVEYDWCSVTVHCMDGSTYEYNCEDDGDGALRVLDRLRAIAAFVGAKESTNKVDFDW